MSSRDRMVSDRKRAIGPTIFHYAMTWVSRNGLEVASDMALNAKFKIVRAMIKPTLITLLSVSLFLPALGGDEDRKRAEREAELRHMRDKESGRAMEAAQHFGNIAKYEERYGWAKEDFKFEFDGLLAKRKAAGRAWQEAAERLKRAGDWQDVHAIKMAAYRADAIAYLAERELKAQGSERQWMRDADKAGTEEAAKVARAMIENQRKMIEVLRAKLAREHELRELEHKHHLLERAQREQHEKARRQHEEKHRPEPKPEPERRDPPKIRIE